MLNQTAQVLASLTAIIQSLLVSDPFFAHVVMRMRREVTTEVETAAVTVRAGTVWLLLNPTFWLVRLQRDRHRLGVLKHEVLHVVLGHLQRASDFPDQERFNVAADLAVNSLIDRESLPEGALMVDTPGLLEGLDRVSGQALDWYYPRLRADAAKSAAQAAASGRGAGSEVWKEIDPSLEGAAVKDLIRRSTQATSGSSLERLSAGIRSAIDQVLEAVPSVDWRRALRAFGARSHRTVIRNTLKRPSKRFGRVPGIRIQPRSHLAVVLDTSGSIGSEQLARFFAELRGVWRTGASITVVECDDAVGRVWSYRGEVAAGCSGGGGTDFDPALAWVNEKAAGIDGVIFMTDGEGNRSLACRRRVMWLITGSPDLSKVQREIARPGELLVAMRD